ncbi:MAG: hypothetical protein RL264_233 [Bacteroidota bacterium]
MLQLFTFRFSLTILFVFLLSLISFSQNEVAIKKRAEDFFAKEDYTNATNDYRQLLTYQPRNIEYNFHYGVCLYYTDAVSSAKKYFDFVIRQPEVPAEAYYYRAKIYQHDYNFEKAIDFFTKLKTLKVKKELLVQADREIMFCQQAQKQITVGAPLSVVSKNKYPGNDFYQHYAFSGKKYSFYSADEVFPKINLKYNFKPIYAFIRGMKYRIFASYTEDGKGKDLFIQKKDEVGEWGKAVRLPATINSEFDEDFAFYDEKEKVLYFSSNGHNSIGAYDMFKVNYDLDNNVGDKVENLGFPYSSPDDDLFYIPDPAGKLAFFASNRHGVLNQFEVYTVNVSAKAPKFQFISGSFSDLIDPKNTELTVFIQNTDTKERFGPIYPDNKGNLTLGFPSDGNYTYNMKVSGSTGNFTHDFSVKRPPYGKVFFHEFTFFEENEIEKMTVKEILIDTNATFQDVGRQLELIARMDVSSAVIESTTNTPSDTTTLALVSKTETKVEKTVVEPKIEEKVVPEIVETKVEKTVVEPKIEEKVVPEIVETKVEKTVVEPKIEEKVVPEIVETKVEKTVVEPKIEEKVVPEIVETKIEKTVVEPKIEEKVVPEIVETKIEKTVVEPKIEEKVVPEIVENKVETSNPITLAQFYDKQLRQIKAIDNSSEEVRVYKDQLTRTTQIWQLIDDISTQRLAIHEKYPQIGLLNHQFSSGSISAFTTRLQQINIELNSLTSLPIREQLIEEQAYLKQLVDQAKKVENYTSNKTLHATFVKIEPNTKSTNSNFQSQKEYREFCDARNKWQELENERIGLEMNLVKNRELLEFALLNGEQNTLESKKKLLGTLQSNALRLDSIQKQQAAINANWEKNKLIAQYELAYQNRLTPTYSAIPQTIKKTTPKPEAKPVPVTQQVVTTTSNFVNFPINEKAPSGLYFRIQLGAHKKALPTHLYQEFSPVSGEKSTNFTFYLTGYFNSIDHANKAKAEVRAVGYSDAFVVAYCDGKRITDTESKLLLQQKTCMPIKYEKFEILSRERYKEGTLQGTTTVTTVVQPVPIVEQQPIISEVKSTTTSFEFVSPAVVSESRQLNLVRLEKSVSPEKAAATMKILAVFGNVQYDIDNEVIHTEIVDANFNFLSPILRAEMIEKKIDLKSKLGSIVLTDETPFANASFSDWWTHNSFLFRYDGKNLILFPRDEDEKMMIQSNLNTFNLRFE